MYDFYYGGILDDAYDNVPYREWSDLNTKEYRQWSDTSTEVYREWSDFSSDVYAFWSNLSSKIWNGDLEEANEVVRDFQEDIEDIKNGKQRTNIESKDPEAEITDIPSDADIPANEPINGIRTEFKTAMDSYEAFFDEYAIFMNNFSNSDNTLAAFSDYADFMSRYTETMEAMEALGEEDMSTEEAAYYLEVTTRINQKLLGALS